MYEELLISYLLLYIYTDGSCKSTITVLLFYVLNVCKDIYLNIYIYWGRFYHIAYNWRVQNLMFSFLWLIFNSTICFNHSSIFIFYFPLTFTYSPIVLHFFLFWFFNMIYFAVLYCVGAFACTHNSLCVCILVHTWACMMVGAEKYWLKLLSFNFYLETFMCEYIRTGI